MQFPFILRQLALAAGLLTAASCQKVVTLDLKNTSPQLTIEANLADDGQPCTVLLSKSVDYTQTNSFPAVSGAAITLSDDAGGRETLAETSTPGKYRGRTLTGQSGRRYMLRVETEGQAYVAACTLPAPVVPLLSLKAQKSVVGTNIQLVPEYQDPAGVPNYYLFRQYRNGRLNKTIFLQNDEFTDGKLNARGLNAQGGGNNADDADKLATGDSVRVEMQNLDPNAFEYFRTLNQTLQAGGAFSTTPANPKSNFAGGVLGYFSAHSRRQRSLVVPAL
ncbi:DUF4249 domain-containing protein [Hymenobacter sp. H14-R3]|uniref:DUF4249 domain-containing protein n=1 Tax=Hymenobacter sp. H14-R3 TaxID=3046308 RepID=UPI0024BAC8CD|nr:DUF4249 domain-containing protein [Hymenobacter sp. H14-R3]MDJ0364225.1 DUF4249 domain-containing protein [Hymenobacter sp. H14-R3]